MRYNWLQRFLAAESLAATRALNCGGYMFSRRVIDAPCKDFAEKCAYSLVKNLGTTICVWLAVP